MNIFWKDYGIEINIEYRNGPEVISFARVLKHPENWIVDWIDTLPIYRKKGYAQAIVRKIVEISGAPVNPFEIEHDAIGFWEKMEKLGLAKL